LNSLDCDSLNPEGLIKRLYVLLSHQLGCCISRIRKLLFKWFDDSLWVKPEAGSRYVLVIPGFLDKNHQGGIALIGRKHVSGYPIVFHPLSRFWIQL